MNQNKLNSLQTRLKEFGQKLSPELCKEFRQILDDFTILHYEFGEAYKMACIDLIPSKTQQTTQQQDIIQTPVSTFKPATKLENLVMALARNLDSTLKK